jgi:geranylgeranyl diphosphate synthase, type I
MVSFSPTLDELREAVDAELTAFLEDRRSDLDEASLLLDEMDRLLLAGGKRLRPAFCYWGFRAARGSHGNEIVRAAAALELLHTFAIVHDDIMDKADERRGAPTVHVRYGLDVALLVGDLALVLADALFAESGFAPDVILDAFSDYSRMRQEVIAGQYLDLRAGSEADVTEERARRIAVLKSGRYSVEQPLAIGAALAGAPREERDRLVLFGRPLGEAFQLRDDLLGTFGERAATGKPIDSDIRQGKHHVLFAKTVARLDEPDRSFFVANWGAGERLTDEDIDRLRAAIESSGAREETEALLETQTDAALDALTALGVDGASRAALEALVVEATARVI